MQELEEKIGYVINPDLGDGIKKPHEFSRNVERGFADTTEKVINNIGNLMEGTYLPLIVVRKFFIPEVKEVNIGDHLFVQCAVICITDYTLVMEE